MKRYFSILTLLVVAGLHAQDLEVTGKTINPSSNINDGVIDVEVSGGTPPYTYKRSNQETPLRANRASGLVEGVSYTVIITDAKGATATKVFKVPTEAITEVFNGAMTPAVGALGSVLFWDPSRPWVYLIL